MRVASSILQKVEPKFLITDGDRAGGETVQPRQFLEVHLGFLKPFFCKITLLLLLLAGSSRTVACFTASALSRKLFDHGPVEGEIFCLMSSTGVPGDGISEFISTEDVSKIIFPLPLSECTEEFFFL